ncbi:NADase-type glycan-binding domain-containing protein [Zobellia nedashkovskayae]
MLLQHLLFVLLFFLTSYSAKSQVPPSLDSTIGAPYNFVEKQSYWSICDSLDQHLFPKETYTRNQWNAFRDKCDEIGFSQAKKDPFSIVSGNDWTDESYNIQKLDKHMPFCSVSSALSTLKDNIYNQTSISDLSYATAWVEGVKGDGIGQYVEFNFPAQHPRITAIKIANGYVKDKTTWQNNSRVKQLKVCVNNKEFAILNLKDVYAEQTFKIPTIGYEITYRGLNKDGTSWYSYKDANGEIFKSYNKEITTGDTIRFEIMSVYKGDKYDDTAITEIYFDGLDMY